MESKPNFAKVHGPWWTQIKVVLIQKGLLDNQNPGFCMGWPGLYLLDNIDQLGSLCSSRKLKQVLGKPVKSLISGFSLQKRHLNRQNQICLNIFEISAGLQGYHIFNQLHNQATYSFKPKSLWRECSVFPRLGTGDTDRWQITLCLCATCQCLQCPISEKRCDPPQSDLTPWILTLQGLLFSREMHR